MWGDTPIINGKKLDLENCFIRLKFANILNTDILKQIGTLEKNESEALEEKLRYSF